MFRNNARKRSTRRSLTSIEEVGVVSDPEVEREAAHDGDQGRESEPSPTTSTHHHDRRRVLFDRMVRQLDRDWVARGLNHLIRSHDSEIDYSDDESDIKPVGFMHGSLLFLLDISEDYQSFTLGSAVHDIDREDELEQLDRSCNTFLCDLDMGSNTSGLEFSMERSDENREISLQQTIDVNLLTLRLRTSLILLSSSFSAWPRKRARP